MNRLLPLLAGLFLFSGNYLSADEGMWLFNNPPNKILKDRYDFELTPDWLEHLQKSSVRFNSGGSGSFVSSQGLVMTNHHVGADALQKLSTADKNYLDIGFHARSREEEVRCLDLELNVLMSIEDVTDRVSAAVEPGMESAAAHEARRAVMNTIEKESLDKTGLRSDVVTLYQGGQYHLYRFKKYTDVRLVFAPEKDIAFFGGDPDNFEYPRYCLDVCFFRVYEDDQPAEIEHFLRWSAAGADEGELIFVSGHPGRTDRLNTVRHLEFLRDRVFPASLDLLRRRELLLRTYSERGTENARRAQDELFGYQNSRKARLGGLAGLQDPSLMQLKQEQEQALRESVEKSQRLRGRYGSAWKDIAQALQSWDEMYEELSLWEEGRAFNSDLFHTARILVRLAEESGKPNSERLRAYRESNLESLRMELFSEAPIYPDLEVVKLADSLSMLLEQTAREPDSDSRALALRVLDGKSPGERARELISGTQLRDTETRRALADGGQQAIEQAEDPLILLARLVDRPARKLRKAYEAQVEEPLRQSYDKIAKARFAIEGSETYPDATFTLRLAFGEVQGYQEGDQQIPAWTELGGTYKHAAAHNHQPPYNLPKSWIERRDELDLTTPFNFVSTADIIGGNSGSPVVNRQGEIVGIIFDGNIHSLVLDFLYTDVQARAVSVHSAGIVEALRKVYDAQDLADELGR